jgi:hypothetical protein
VEGCGEVQTPVRVPKTAGNLPLGTPVLFRHAKAGELAERFQHVWLFQKGKAPSKAPTYRGDGQCYF